MSPQASVGQEPRAEHLPSKAGTVKDADIVDLEQVKENLKKQFQEAKIAKLVNSRNLEEEEDKDKESDPDWRPTNSAKSKTAGSSYRRGFDHIANSQLDMDNVTFPYQCEPCRTTGIRDRRDLERHLGTKKHLFKTGGVNSQEDWSHIKKARTFAQGGNSIEKFWL